MSISRLGFYIGKDDIKRSPLTLSLISINIVIFVILNIVFELILNNSSYLLLFAQNNSEISQGKEIWSLFTSIFIHWDFFHLLSNMLALFVFGLSAEKVYNRWQYLLIYVLSGLIGSLFSYLFTPVYSYGGGASGAIYGLMVVVFIKIGASNPTYLFLAIIYIVIKLFDGSKNYAHLFGALGGLLIGLVIKAYENSKFIKNHTSNYSKRKNFKRKRSQRSGKPLFQKNVRNKRKRPQKSPKTFSPKLTKFDSSLTSLKYNSRSDFEIYLLQQIRDILIVNGHQTVERTASLLNMKTLDLMPRLKIWEKKLAFHLDKDIIYVDNPTELVLQIDQILDQWEQSK